MSSKYESREDPGLIPHSFKSVLLVYSGVPDFCFQNLDRAQIGQIFTFLAGAGGRAGFGKIYCTSIMIGFLQK